jgi:hypothetical protein
MEMLGCWESVVKGSRLLYIQNEDSFQATYGRQVEFVKLFSDVAPAEKDKD